ncbi:MULTISPECIES: AraC family transcriptional regulator [unclassified Leisingera]|uniref:AraC family transcriptional regulator n=1 Tax=unclassified Leisingera TaxID=2614906 RepID=UPI00057DC0F9|nr:MULTISPECIES: AraC family transcriptional regulator [unclassified Leisingera]KIC18148.1 AraC family transcriptional regulator [Leisingera sp. ANG-DT]KIC27780.1 AraC family transcriptional regulator [Leisingera sp. ANG-M6]
MLDLLSDILTRLSLKGTLYFRTSFTPPWGVHVPSFQNVARFHFAHRGECLVHLPQTGDTIRLAQGDLVVIPHGAEHMLFCSTTGKEAVLTLERVLELSGYQGEGVLVYGGDEDDRDTQLICGHISYGAQGHTGAGHMLLDRLPPYMHIQDYGEARGAWLEATLRVIAAEAGQARMGGDLIALKMSEAIFAQAIRVHLESLTSDDSALAGFADPRLHRALTAFHKNPAANWSVEDLARTAGMSRTGFAQTFTAKMEVTPMQYLTSWRMQIACQGLAEQGLNVADAAELAGYASEAAFSRVFRKQVGLSPAAYRQKHANVDFSETSHM